MDHPSAVSLVPCPHYERERVFEAVRRAIDLVGGMGRFVKPGDPVLLKANLTSIRIPASCTHPFVVGAVARLAREAGGEVLIADAIPEHLGGLWQRVWTQVEDRLKGLDYDAASGFIEKLQALEDPHGVLGLVPPGASHPLFTEADLGSEAMVREQLTRVEYLAEAERVGARCVALDALPRREVPRPDGVFLKRVLLTELLTPKTVLLDVPRLKTHNLMGYTGAVKNCFGLVPGSRRGRYHELSRLAGCMAEMFIDIYGLARPALSVMDGVIGMEGDGPIDGDMRAIGLIAASADGVALDAVCGSVIGLEPGEVPTTKAGAARGLGEADLSKIPLPGEAIQRFRISDFKRPPAKSVRRRAG